MVIEIDVECPDIPLQRVHLGLPLLCMEGLGRDEVRAEQA